MFLGSSLSLKVVKLVQILVKGLPRVSAARNECSAQRHALCLSCIILGNTPDKYCMTHAANPSTNQMLPPPLVRPVAVHSSDAATCVFPHVRLRRRMTVSTTVLAHGRRKLNMSSSWAPSFVLPQDSAASRMQQKLLSRYSELIQKMLRGRPPHTHTKDGTHTTTASLD